jgi:molybdenum cofactor synthesis domain-containing protein
VRPVTSRPDPRARRITTAEILSIGSEITTGETRDTNAGDLARDLSARGVTVGRIIALPDRRGVVEAALREALERADLVVTTGGLGPTPDDLTRESIAAVLGEEPAVDPALAAHIRDLFERRGLPMPDLNLKQAWLIPSAQALANPHGSAPGWWVEVVPPDGQASDAASHNWAPGPSGVIVALPGPPSEMWPMWTNEALPRLEARGLGEGRVVRVVRLTAMGESQIVATLGEELFRRGNPEVATYARSDAVDIRISAVDDDGRLAAELVEDVERHIAETLGPQIFAGKDEDWPAALGRMLASRRVATVEAGTGGRLVALLGGAPWLAHAEVIPTARLSELAGLARSAREDHDVDLGLAVRAAPRRGDTVATIAIDDARLGAWRESRVVFLGGEAGQRRAALAACAVLYAGLRDRQAG